MWVGFRPLAVVLSLHEIASTSVPQPSERAAKPGVWSRRVGPGAALSYTQMFILCRRQLQHVVDGPRLSTLTPWLRLVPDECIVRLCSNDGWLRELSCTCSLRMHGMYSVGLFRAVRRCVS
jgi:hypothetical protein